MRRLSEAKKMEQKESKLIRGFRESGRPIVVSVSGGKDSTAMALWLKEQEFEKTNPIFYVFADTGWEHPDLMDYIENYLNEKVFGGALNIVRSKKYPKGMVELVEKRGMFPSRKIRFCTQELKIFPIRDFIDGVRAEYVDREIPLNTIGIRAAESVARSKMLEFEPGTMLDRTRMEKPLCDTWRPLISFVVKDVIEIHTRNGIAPCPLYLRDTLPASRVGCWPCIMNRKSEIKSVALTDPKRIDEIRALEKIVEIKARERYAKKGETFESLGYTPPTFFQSRNGTGEQWPIDKVVEWSKTSYGGKQMELFLPNEEERGCQMWGLCDVPSEDDE